MFVFTILNRCRGLSRRVWQRNWMLCRPRTSHFRLDTRRTCKGVCINCYLSCGINAQLLCTTPHSLKLALEDAEQDRDNLRYKLSESKRENDKLSERLSCLGPSHNTSKREIENVISQRDKLKKQVESLSRELRLAQEKVASARSEPQREKSQREGEVSELKAELSHMKQEGQNLTKERERLAEENGDLRSKLERAEARIHSLEVECRRWALSECDEAHLYCYIIFSAYFVCAIYISGYVTAAQWEVWEGWVEVPCAGAQRTYSLFEAKGTVALCPTRSSLQLVHPLCIICTYSALCTCKL